MTSLHLAGAHLATEVPVVPDQSCAEFAIAFDQNRLELAEVTAFYLNNLPCISSETGLHVLVHLNGWHKLDDEGVNSGKWVPLAVAYPGCALLSWRDMPDSPS